jgi:hypothetical protein
VDVRTWSCPLRHRRQVIPAPLIANQTIVVFIIWYYRLSRDFSFACRRIRRFALFSDAMTPDPSRRFTHYQVTLCDNMLIYLKYAWTATF